MDLDYSRSYVVPLEQHGGGELPEAGSVFYSSWRAELQSLSLNEAMDAAHALAGETRLHAVCIEGERSSVV